ncbi:hypothetical protein [Antarcticimicrobium luteum]|uniref:Uncharacterized protein n=1 Tax=Antarcticimicrobium luteum TaxID=2547397 RepID=A0A4R5VFT2_9RHOB|nr:hypothetical protein [Antarcticimicrobium luteum]TDK50706.1 hypothetical protein E1832_05780 [Antarcticimicrobium luteum]
MKEVTMSSLFVLFLRHVIRGTARKHSAGSEANAIRGCSNTRPGKDGPEPTFKPSAEKGRMQPFPAGRT